MHIPCGGMLREKIVIPEAQSKNVGGVSKSRQSNEERGRTRWDHENRMQRVCERGREKIDGATMKESGGHCTTVSARNEYAVVHCVIVLDSASRKRYTYAKRSGRNKHRNAKSCPRNRDQIGKMEGRPRRCWVYGLCSLC